MSATTTARSVRKAYAWICTYFNTSGEVIRTGSCLATNADRAKEVFKRDAPADAYDGMASCIEVIPEGCIYTFHIQIQ